MSSSSIRLSPKHGINPSIPKCFYCQEDKSEIVFFGLLPNDAEAPMHGPIIDMGPCDECASLMKKGVLLISVRDGEMEKEEEALDRARASFERAHGYRSEKWKADRFGYIPNPYRTGGWVVVSDDAFSRAVTGDMRDYVLGTRWSFIPDEVWNALGLPS